MILTAVYEAVPKYANRPLAPPYSQEMESAFSDIQLFGSLEQLALLMQFAAVHAQSGQVSKSGLDSLASLRDELKAEARGRTFHVLPGYFARARKVEEVRQARSGFIRVDERPRKRSG